MRFCTGRGSKVLEDYYGGPEEASESLLGYLKSLNFLSEQFNEALLPKGGAFDANKDTLEKIHYELRQNGHNQFDDLYKELIKISEEY